MYLRTKPKALRLNTLIASILLLGVMMFLSLGMSPASAHDSVTRSVPSQDENLAEFPSKIEVEFSGTPGADYNTIAVNSVDDSGQTNLLFSGIPEQNGQVLTLDTPSDVAPGEGNYAIAYRITSSDGHATDGQISFSVGQNFSSEKQSDESASEGSDAMRIFLGIGGITVLLGALILAIRAWNAQKGK